MDDGGSLIRKPTLMSPSNVSAFAGKRVTTSGFPRAPWKTARRNATAAHRLADASCSMIPTAGPHPRGPAWGRRPRRRRRSQPCECAVAKTCREQPRGQTARKAQGA
eukprot:6723566-Prymnesium_polylepis.1